MSQLIYTVGEDRSLQAVAPLCWPWGDVVLAGCWAGWLAGWLAGWQTRGADTSAGGVRGEELRLSELHDGEPRLGEHRSHVCARLSGGSLADRTAR